MPLTLYRRHTKSCKVHTLGLPPQAKRAYTDCDCPIWITGTVGRNVYPRQSTGLRDWRAAQALRLSIEAENPTGNRHPIQAAIDAFMAAHGQEVSSGTLANYRVALAQFAEHCASRNVFFLDEITPEMVEAIRIAMLKRYAPGSARLYFGKAMAFLRYCFRIGLTDNRAFERFRCPAPDYEAPAPFTDEEIARILAAADHLPLIAPTSWMPPSTARAIIQLMLETGMRAGDAIQFDPSVAVRTPDGTWRYRFRPEKTRKRRSRYIDAYVRDQTYRLIQQCQWLSPSRPFLPDGIAPRSMYKRIYNLMGCIGSACGIPKCRPHRLRDTFAVRMLLAGVGIADVSRLLGHSSVLVTEKHYAPWTESRTARLGRIVTEALMHTAGHTGGDGQNDISPRPGSLPS